jgi:hypothetical protein
MAGLTIGDQFSAAAAGISGKDVIGPGIREKSPAGDVYLYLSTT